MQTTKYATNAELIAAIRRLKGPIHVDVLIGEDHDPIPVQIIKADLIWRLSATTSPTDAACLFLAQYPNGMQRLIAEWN